MILVDTEGLRGSGEADAKIFSFSALLLSMLIFSVSRKIREADLKTSLGAALT